LFRTILFYCSTVGFIRTLRHCLRSSKLPNRYMVPKPFGVRVWRFKIGFVVLFLSFQVLLGVSWAFKDSSGPNLLSSFGIVDWSYLVGSPHGFTRWDTSRVFQGFSCPSSGIIPFSTVWLSVRLWKIHMVFFTAFKQLVLEPSQWFGFQYFSWDV